MRHAFVDTFFWVAVANARDQWHDATMMVSQSLGEVRLTTTDEVLVEFLTLLSSYGAEMRRAAVRLVRSIFEDPNILVRPQTRNSFMAGLALYEARLDKAYSLTDCISMQTMRDEDLTEVLTNDRHFTQEGFSVLITGEAG